MDDTTLWDARETVAALGRRLLDQELTRGTGGNVSVRRDDRVAVSPSGIPYEDVTPEMVPVVDLDGERVSGADEDAYEPSSETPLHTRIYRQRSSVGGIVHTHSVYASTFASLGEEIPASHYLIAYAGREVPVAGYAPPGSAELGRLAVEALGDDHDACLLQNHGAVAVGETGRDAIETALMVEHCAQVHFQASAIGDPIVMADEDVDDLVEMFSAYRRKADE